VAIIRISTIFGQKSGPMRPPGAKKSMPLALR
jgi:hypothetical protein